MSLGRWMLGLILLDQGYRNHAARENFRWASQSVWAYFVYCVMNERSNGRWRLNNESWHPMVRNSYGDPRLSVQGEDPQ